jgi:hypothetical protein
MAQGSIRPSEAKEGGLLDDADVTIVQARFANYDFNGKADTKMVLAVEMKQDGEEKSHVEYYSAGDPKFFVPLADGKGYDCVADKTALYKSCNAIAFLGSLVKAGYPESKLGSDPSVIDGLKVHVSRVAAKARKFKDGRSSKEDATILLVTKLNSAVAGGGQGVSAPGVAAASPVEDKAVAAVSALLAANSGLLAVSRMGTEVFKALAGKPERNDVLKLVTPAWLASGDKPWTVDGDMVVAK